MKTRDWCLAALVLALGQLVARADGDDIRDILRDAESGAIAAGQEGILNLLPEIGRVWAALGDMDSAARVFDQSLRAVQAADMDPFERQVKVVALTEIRAGAGDIAGALQGCRGNCGIDACGSRKRHALFEIALAQDKAADQAGAARTFEEALQLARQGGGGYVLHEIARHYGKTGQLERALQIVDIEPDETMNSLGRRLLAVDQAELGHTAQAIDIANSLPDGNDRAFVFYNIGLAQSKTDRDAAAASFQIALAAAASEVGGGVEIQAFCGIAVAQADLGATDVAAATIEQARQAALVYEEDVYRASLYQMIAKARTQSSAAEWARP